MKTKFLLIFATGFSCANFSSTYCAYADDLARECIKRMSKESSREKLLISIPVIIKNKQDINESLENNCEYFRINNERCHVPVSPLYSSIHHGYDDIIELLLKNGANPSQFKYIYDGYIPLTKASCLKNYNVVKILLKYGANPYKPDEFDTTLCDIAHDNNDKILTKIFKEFNNKEKDSAKLFEAIEENNLLKLRFFLKKDFVNPNIQNELGETPLHIAVLVENIDAIIYLLGHGANIWITNKNGQTPIHYAASKPDTLKFLLEIGNKLNSQE
ncbi:ankyrin repeat domain-containing protein [Candidatus Dependentiae bacterium]|nr:ankyrin repeat domain-containing protein [Candidatus Dependentiae bacterium]